MRPARFPVHSIRPAERPQRMRLPRTKLPMKSAGSWPGLLLDVHVDSQSAFVVEDARRQRERQVQVVRQRLKIDKAIRFPAARHLLYQFGDRTQEHAEVRVG